MFTMSVGMCLVLKAAFNGKCRWYPLQSSKVVVGQRKFKNLVEIRNISGGFCEMLCKNLIETCPIYYIKRECGKINKNKLGSRN